MIIITGAAGFIGSVLAWKLNELGRTDLVLVDKLGDGDKWKNISKRNYQTWLDIDDLEGFLKSKKAKEIDAIFHLGAISSTTENNMDLLMKVNVNYSKMLWHFATKYNAPYIYASSAATYGDGEQGYDDDQSLNAHLKLKPMNKYGYSKKLFDVWALQQEKSPRVWVGLKFFNVYGPNEYHKGSMASMVFHSFNQTNQSGKVKLFKSHKKGYDDGGQLRDFVYVKDAVDVMLHFWESNVCGIFNVGTGSAESFKELTTQTMRAMKKTPKIEYVPMPQHLRAQYQYFTQANIDRLREAGYQKSFHTLKEGVTDYVKILKKDDPYL